MKVQFYLKAIMRWLSERAKNQGGLSPLSEAMTLTLILSGKSRSHHALTKWSTLKFRRDVCSFLSRYSLQGDTKKYFSIGKYSGELKTVQALDREENSTYTMEVIAVDGRKMDFIISH